MLSKIQGKKLVEIILDKTHAFDNAIILFITNKIEQNDDVEKVIFVDEDDETNEESCDYDSNEENAKTV